MVPNIWLKGILSLITNENNDPLVKHIHKEVKVDY